MTQTEARAKLFTLKVTGRLVPLDDIKAIAKAMGYEWTGGWGPAAGDPRARSTFKTPAGGCFRAPQQLALDLTAHCPVDGCGRRHDRWANYSAAKENDDSLVAVCEAGHQYDHDEGATVWQVRQIEEGPAKEV